jgi:anti-sigma factor RsiW
MMSCEQAQQLLVQQQVDALSPLQHQQLTTHTTTCAACAAEAASWQQLALALQQQQQPSAAARVKFIAQLQSELTQQASPLTATAPVKTVKPTTSAWPRFFQHLWPAQPMGAVSYSAALLTVGLLVGQLLPPRSLGVGIENNELVFGPLQQERPIQLCSMPPAPPRLL